MRPELTAFASRRATSCMSTGSTTFLERPRRRGPKAVADRLITHGTKTKICFMGAGIAAALSLCCFAGAVMNGSFAVAGPVNADGFQRSAAVLFWVSVFFATVALCGLTWGFVRRQRRHKQSDTTAAPQAVEADGRASS
jgi:hypothetical protein